MPETYSAVESYAKQNQGTDAAALAWFTIANARLRDKDYAKVLEALDHVRFQTGLLDDYIVYQRAQAFSGLGSSEQVVKTLKDFETRYPDSLLKSDAALLCANALLSFGTASEAVEVLKLHRSPGRTDIDLALGKAYVSAGDIRNAASLFQRVFYRSPLSVDAELAASELKAQGASAQIPQAAFSERRARAEMLLQGGRWDRAVQELQDLQRWAAEPERARGGLLLAQAVLKSGQRKNAKELLEQLRPSTAEESAERTYRLLEIARTDGDERRVQELLNELRAAHAQSPWRDRALLSAANMALLKQDMDKGIARFTELSFRFPSSPRASYALWRASWLTFRLGRIADAKAGFEKQVQVYPTSPEAPSALYWRARIAEEENEQTTARAWYTKLSERFPNHYYTQQAQARLGGVRADTTLPRISLLDGMPSMPRTSNLLEKAGALRHDVKFQKCKLLENAGLGDFAINELQSLAERQESWVAFEVARLYQESGQYHRALRTLRKTIPGYFSLQLTSLPEPVRSSLFPLPYWEHVRSYSTQNGVDPILTLALIRQESEFNPAAISAANAIGLMQLLPSTAAPIARNSGLAGFSPQALMEPSMNIRLGTRHFADLLKRFDGTPEYALAAYNAGADRVKQWLGAGTYRDVPEFVEAIPFSETREYVKAIVRNIAIYQAIYARPNGSQSSGANDSWISCGRSTSCALIPISVEVTNETTDATDAGARDGHRNTREGDQYDTRRQTGTGCRMIQGIRGAGSYRGASVGQAVAVRDRESKWEGSRTCSPGPLAVECPDSWLESSLPPC